MQNFGDESTNWVRRYVLFPRSLYHLEQGGRWQRIRLTVLSSAEVRPHAWKWPFPPKKRKVAARRKNITSRQGPRTKHGIGRACGHRNFHNTVLKVLFSGGYIPGKIPCVQKEQFWCRLSIIRRLEGKDGPACQLPGLLFSPSKQNLQHGTIENANDKPETLNGGQKEKVAKAVRA